VPVWPPVEWFRLFQVRIHPHFRSGCGAGVLASERAGGVYLGGQGGQSTANRGLLNDNPLLAFSRDREFGPWVEADSQARGKGNALHVAHSTAVVELLLRTMRSCAVARCGDRAQAQRAWHAFINQKDEVGSTPLHGAALEKDPGMAAALLANGADVNASGQDGNTPLHSTVKCRPIDGASAPAARVLLANGANVNAKNDDCRTPLHLAVRGYGEQHLQVAEILLLNGADPNARGQYGETPLHYAAVNDRPGVTLVELLIASGADVNAVDNSGTTPLHAAASRNCHAWDTVGYGDIGPGPVMVALLSGGADASATDNKGKTPLEIASKADPYEGRAEVLRLLRVSTASHQG